MSNRGVSSNWPASRWIAIAGCLGLLLLVLLQWRAVSELRHQNDWLRAQIQDARPDAPRQSIASAQGEGVEMEQLRQDQLELLRLRNEVRQLREQASPATADSRPLASQPLKSSATALLPAGDEARQLAIAAMGGDTSAVDKLARLAAGIRTLNPDEQPAARAGIKSAFELLGAEAGKGNASALQALWQASRVRGLQGFATQGLGQAAGLGNEEALKPLLDPEAYFLLRSSAVSALKPAADAGNERAIQALAATAGDPKQEALWLLAAHGLESAAATGNATAIDGLATIAAGTNQMIGKEAVLALEAAARNGQPRAEAALSKLGWR